MPNKTQSGPDRSLAELHRATDTLSTMLSQEVRDLHARQKAARRQEGGDPGTIKALKETTAVLKDLASVARSLNEQGAETGGAASSKESLSSGFYGSSPGAVIQEASAGSMR